MDEIVRALECLELKPGATQEEVRKAYRELAMVWHPDRFPADSPLRAKADERLKEINQAYNFLMKHGFVDGQPVLPPVETVEETEPKTEPPSEPPPADFEVLKQRQGSYRRVWIWAAILVIIPLIMFVKNTVLQPRKFASTNPVASATSTNMNVGLRSPASPSNTPVPATATEKFSILSLHAVGCTSTNNPDGTITFREGELVTDEEFAPPFTMRVVAKTDLTNIRLHYAGRGWVILNWEVNPLELRYQDPRDGHVTPVPGQGKVEPNVWQDVQWVVETNGSTVLVNGQKRASFTGDYAGLNDVLGIGVCNGSKLDLRHFSVQRRGEPQKPAPVNVTSNLVLHFSFDDILAGGVVPDLSPYRNNGRVVGVTAVPDGKLGGAFDFRGGASNYVVVPHSLSLVSMQNTRQMTLAVWLKPRSLIGQFPVILAKGGSFAPRYIGGYELLLNDLHDLQLSTGSYGLWTVRAEGRWIGKHFGKWIHVALVVNAQTGLRKFYVNGQRTGDEQEFNSPDLSQINLAHPVALYIGVPPPNNHPNRGRYDGLMDDLRIYSRALTSEEIAALANLPGNAL